MHDRFTDLLSGYLDRDLPRSEQDAVRRHLDTCAECRDVLAMLEGVKTRAASLVDPPVPTDLWAGIASRLGPAGSSSAAPARHAVVLELPRRVPAVATWQWIAAAAAFVVVASGALWLAHDRLSPPLRPLAVSQPDRKTDASAAEFDATHIETEIGQLQQALDRGRGKLDPKTVKVLEENLRIIRKATEDARHALEQDPANRDLQDYLAGSVQRKLDLVRRAATMAGV